jgi:hypothetical protein
MRSRPALPAPSSCLIPSEPCAGGRERENGMGIRTGTKEKNVASGDKETEGRCQDKEKKRRRTDEIPQGFMRNFRKL